MGIRVLVQQCYYDIGLNILTLLSVILVQRYQLVVTEVLVSGTQCERDPVLTFKIVPEMSSSLSLVNNRFV